MSFSKDLPGTLSQLIEEVVAAARLEGDEAQAVRDELVGHFEEGLEQGRSPESLTEEFGDRTVAAQLIARGRRRLRREDEALPAEIRVESDGTLAGRLDALWFDLRYSLRGLVRSPGFTLVGIVLLALGVGVNTAIFSVARATLLSQLPLTEADRLVRPYFANDTRGLGRSNVPFLDFDEWRNQQGLFGALSVYAGVGLDLQEDPPLRISGLRASEDFFDVFQVAPLLGRLFATGEFVEGNGDVVVLSKSLWENRFGADPEVLGSLIRFNGRQHAVIGVVDEALTWPGPTQFWVPWELTAAGAADRQARDSFSWQIVGRLAEGVALSSVQARLLDMSRQVATDQPARRANWEARVMPLREWIVGPRLPPILFALMASATFVFLIVCVNVAGLMVTRASAKSRQLAVRVAVGARPWQLARQLLTESVFLFVIGGAVGLPVAQLVLRLLLAQAPSNVPLVSSATIDLQEFLFALGLAAAAGLIFGLYPALRACRQSPTQTLREGTSASESRSSHRLRFGLVVTEVALSAVLLSGAGLMVRSLYEMNRSDPGFRPDHLLTFGVFPPTDRYAQPEDFEQFYEQVGQELLSLPGVEQVSSTTWMPIGGGGIGLGRAHLAEGMPEPPGGPDYSARWIGAAPDLFATLDWPIRRGRAFRSTDDATSPPVAIINEVLAEHMFGSEDPIGKRVRSWRDENVYREIVGVVGNLRIDTVTEQMQPLFVVPGRQIPWSRFRYVVMRTRVDPGELMPQLQERVSRIDPLLPAQNARTGETIFESSVAAAEFTTVLLSLFAALGLTVASVGLYGVLAGSVASRTKELGIRAALGADRKRTIGLVLSQALGTTALGLLAGLVGAFGLGSLLSGILFQTGAGDPSTLLLVVVCLLCISLLAAYVPARRATRIDPVKALRMD